MLWVEVGIQEGVKKGREIWKMNVSLLDDDKECQAFRRAYEQWGMLCQDFDTRWEWWEVIKTRVQEWFDGVGRRRARGRKWELK